MRTSAVEQHVKNMGELVKMVEHCTVQKCEQVWPSLYQPPTGDVKGAEQEELAEPQPEGRPKRAATKPKPEPKQVVKQPKKAGRKPNVKVQKAKVTPTDRKSRSDIAKERRKEDTQPVVNLVPGPPSHAGATSGSVFELNSANLNQSPQGSTSDIMSSASTQWMHDLKKQMQEAQQDMKKIYEEDVLNLREQLRELQVQHNHQIAQGAHFKALYDDAKTARDEWKAMVLQLLPNPASQANARYDCGGVRRQWLTVDCVRQ